MKQPKQKKGKQPVKAATPKKAKVAEDLFSTLERVFERNSKGIIITLLSLATLFGILLFDVKISEGNDDALYIEGGYNYATNFTNYFFTANAPMYPMMLGLLISMFGINLILFKVLSLVFFIAHIFFLYKAFKGLVPWLVMVPVLAIVAMNSYFLYYASQTYTESLFVLLQAVFLFSFRKVYEMNPGESMTPSKWSPVLMLGLFAFLITFCKSVALGGILALVFFLLIHRDWKKMVWFLGSFAVFKGGFEVLKMVIWGDKAKSGQSDTLFLVDPYNAAKGRETISGFVDRFFQNMDLYISKRAFQILGFKHPDNIETSSLMSWFVFALFVFAIYLMIKNRKWLLEFVSWYTLAICAITFVVLQTRWDQPRLIMVVTPFILLTVFYGLYMLMKKTGWIGQFAFLIFTSVFVVSSFMVSVKKSAANYPILKKNLNGNVFYGYTPDWENYLKMSRWCSENLPEGSYVACRKAPMSFVYGNGMKFFPVYNVIAVDPATNLAHPDSVIANFEREGVTHVILANLRRNPKKVDGYIINTMHRTVQPVAKKYPQKLTLVKQIGDREPAYVYKINY
jgi:hypothetical protein